MHSSTSIFIFQKCPSHKPSPFHSAAAPFSSALSAGRRPARLYPTGSHPRPPSSSPLSAPSSMLLSNNTLLCLFVFFIQQTTIYLDHSIFLSNSEFRNRQTLLQTGTYARGLNMVSQNQLFPTSGKVIVRTRATLARLMHVQNVSSAAWPRLGTIIPSNLRSNHKCVNTFL